jgi:MFS family permease
MEDSTDVEVHLKPVTFGSTCKHLLVNPTFIGTLMSVTNLYFVVTGIQYWSTFYMIRVLGEKEYHVYIAYSICCITGPTIGVLLGGYITTKVIGGYTSDWAIYVCLFVGILATCVAIPMPMVNQFWAFIVLFWFLLLFGGFMMPNLTGILLNSVPARERAMANSIANFVYNGFGYLPAPYLYGLVAEWTREEGDKG